MLDNDFTPDSQGEDLKPLLILAANTYTKMAAAVEDDRTLLLEPDELTAVLTTMNMAAAEAVEYRMLRRAMDGFTLQTIDGFRAS